MPLIGEILGTCKTVTINKPDDYARYLSIYYTAKNVVGLKLATDQGAILSLGTVTGSTLKTFTFD